MVVICVEEDDNIELLPTDALDANQKEYKSTITVCQDKEPLMNFA